MMLKDAKAVVVCVAGYVNVICACVCRFLPGIHTQPASRNTVRHIRVTGMERTLGAQTAPVWASAARKEEYSVPGVHCTQWIPYHL